VSFLAFNSIVLNLQNPFNLLKTSSLFSGFNFFESLAPADLSFFSSLRLQIAIQITRGPMTALAGYINNSLPASSIPAMNDDIKIS